MSPSRLANLAVRRTRPEGPIRRLFYTYVDLVQQSKARRSPFETVAPAALRLRVHGDFDLDGFLESGRQCSDDIQAALAAVGAEIGSFKRILDFGCGCGRTLQWLAPATAGADVHGTDIDQEAIDWCRRSIDWAIFSSNGEVPPLDYPDGHFDLTYAVSVFTHLSEDLQREWLKELRRVTAENGLVLLTVRGPSYAKHLSSGDRDQLQTRGFVFSEMAPQFQQVFPAWYQLATMSEQFIRQNWSTYFEIVRQLPEALDGCQDIVVLRKR